MADWIVQWLTVRGWAPRLCGSHTRHAALQCLGVGSPAGCPPLSQSPLFSRPVCWLDSGAFWWTWQQTQCLCSSLYNAWQLQTAHCGDKGKKARLLIISMINIFSRLVYKFGAGAILWQQDIAKQILSRNLRVKSVWNILMQFITSCFLMRQRTINQADRVDRVSHLLLQLTSCQSSSFFSSI